MERETSITVLIGLVLGLALARVIAFGARLYRSNEQATRVYWLHLVWVGALFLLIVENWWVICEKWDFNKVNSYWGLSLLLLSPMLLYFLSVLICPNKEDGGGVRLKDLHERTGILFYASLGILFLVYIPEAVFMHKDVQAFSHPMNWMRLGIASIFFLSALFVNKRPALDPFLPPIMILLLVASNWLKN